MAYTVPTEWRELSSYQRDILLSLCVHGPATGSELVDRVGGTTGRNSKEPVYRHLDALEAREYATETPEQDDGRATTHEITESGRSLLWDAVFDGAEAMEDAHE